MYPGLKGNGTFFIRTYLQTRVRLAVSCLCGDCDEAFDLWSLCCVCVEQSVRSEAWLAAVAGPHASADMARHCPGRAVWPAAQHRDGAGTGRGGQRLTTHADGLFAKG